MTTKAIELLEEAIAGLSRPPLAEWSVRAMIRIVTEGDEVQRVIIQPENGADFFHEDGDSPLLKDDGDHAINTALSAYLDTVATYNSPLGAGVVYQLEWEG